MPRAALALLWLLGGTAFLPLVWLGLVGTGRGFDQGLWKSNDALRSAEIWSPQTGRWSRTGDLPEPFWNHEAVLLKGGDVLVLAEGQAGLKAERWSPSSGAWSPAGVATFHSQLRLIALHDGRALVTGIGAASAPGEGVELFDPAQNGWRSLPGPGHGGVICADELPAGVVALTSDPLQKLRTRAARLDLSTLTWTELLPPPETDQCTLTALLDGRALLAFERSTADPADTPLALFDGRRFEMLQEKLAQNLAGLLVGAERLDDGRVLHLLDVSSKAVLWDPRTGRVSSSDTTVSRVRAPVVALLAEARVLATGGTIPTGNERRDLWEPDAVGDAVIWDLDARTATPTAPMLTARELHAAVRLADGRVLVSGGRGPSGHPLWENIAMFFGGGALVLGAPAAVGFGFYKSRARAAAAVAFAIGVLLSLGIIALVVLASLRFPS